MHRDALEANRGTQSQVLARRLGHGQLHGSCRLRAVPDVSGIASRRRPRGSPWSHRLIGASATWKVTAESVQSASVGVGQDTALATHEAAEVSRGPEIANSTCPGISVEFERVRKTIDVRPAETGPQATKGLGGAEIVVQHRGLLGCELGHEWRKHGNQAPPDNGEPSRTRRAQTPRNRVLPFAALPVTEHSP